MNSEQLPLSEADQQKAEEFRQQFDWYLASSRQMAEVLLKDCLAQFELAHTDDSQLYRRAYVRSVFAFIESLLWWMKQTACFIGMHLNTLGVDEQMLLIEVTLEIDDKGEVKQRNSFPRFENNFKFVFKRFSKSFGSTFQVDLNSKGWNSLQTAQKVRDRLMHPKLVEDLEVTDAEFSAAETALQWFFLNYSLSTSYATKAAHTRAPDSPFSSVENDTSIANTEKMLHDLEKKK